VINLAVRRRVLRRVCVKCGYGAHGSSLVTWMKRQESAARASLSTASEEQPTRARLPNSGAKDCAANGTRRTRTELCAVHSPPSLEAYRAGKSKR
jgi:hypothetical protein